MLGLVFMKIKRIPVRMKMMIGVLVAASLTLAPLAQDRSASSANEPQGLQQGFHQDLAWSPDGSKISFSWNGEGNFEIYVAQADGSGVTRLTHDAGSNRYASWSRDGSKIAFASDRAAKGHVDLYVMGTDGSAPTRLTHDPGSSSFPSWSKDGKKIAYMSMRAGHWQIYVMNADGSGQTRLTTSEANDENPSFSPDNKHIVFESNRDGAGKDQLYSMKTDGSSLQRLTHDDANNVFPGFSPDGKRILFGSGRPAVPGNENKIYIMNRDGTGLKELADRGFFARWSPRGDRIAFIAGHYPSSHIYIMKGDGSEKKQLR